MAPRSYSLEDFAPSADFERIDEDWLLSWDGARRAPRWTIERLTPDSFGHAKREGMAFHHHPSECREIPASPDDFNGFTVWYDRGHCARAANHSASEERLKHTFTIRNAMVQWGQLNRGSWKELEESIAARVAPQAVVFVWTGPVFAPDHYPRSAGSRSAVFTVKSIGDNHQQIPSHCAKSILVLRRGSEPEMKSWLFPNDERSEDRPFTDFRTTTDELESLAGCDLWRALPDDLEDRLEASR